MKYDSFRTMMDFLRHHVRIYCDNNKPFTPWEIEGAAWTLGLLAYEIFGGTRDNEALFRAAVEKFVQDEILKVCAS